MSASRTGRLVRWLLVATIGLATACGGAKKVAQAVAARVAGGTREFSAEKVVLKAGRSDSPMKMFVTPAALRVEVQMSRGTMVSIARQDRGVLWMLMPEQRIYHETTLDEDSLAELASRIREDSTTEPLGRETVNGMPCRKLRTHTRVTVMGRTVEASSLVWMWDEIGMPVRTESSDGTVTELRNIRPGPQPASLFEIPPGYTRAEGGLFGSGRGADEPRAARETRRSTNDRKAAPPVVGRLANAFAAERDRLWRKVPHREDPGRLGGVWGGDGGWGEIRLEQEGDEVWGRYEHHDGQLRGTLSGRTVSFVWWERTLPGQDYGDAAAGERGFGSVTLSSDGRRLSGRWSYEGSSGRDGSLSATRR